jgi:UDP-N-acetylglucosamine acyltransferase
MSIDPSAGIHATAIVEPGATFGADCRIGPYCVIGPEVRLGDGVTLHSHVAVTGNTQIGNGTTIWPFASIGHAPQDLKYQGEPSELIIGRNNRIREHSTMNPGTAGGGAVTRIGDGNLFMMGTHVAHDCMLGDNIIMANNATLGGHCVVEDFVIVGGISGVHQFVRLGTGAMVGGMTGVAADVIPFGMITGDRGSLSGLNLIGLKRRGVDRAHINGLRAAFAEITKGEGTMQERIDAIDTEFRGNPLVDEIVRFVRAGSTRSFTQPAA